MFRPTRTKFGLFPHLLAEIDKFWSYRPKTDKLRLHWADFDIFRSYQEKIDIFYHLTCEKWCMFPAHWTKFDMFRPFRNKFGTFLLQLPKLYRLLHSRTKFDMFERLEQLQYILNKISKTKFAKICFAFGNLELNSMFLDLVGPDSII